jgi:hypothetical protein
MILKIIPPRGTVAKYRVEAVMRLKPHEVRVLFSAFAIAVQHRAR